VYKPFIEKLTLDNGFFNFYNGNLEKSLCKLNEECDLKRVIALKINKLPRHTKLNYEVIHRFFPSLKQLTLVNIRPTNNIIKKSIAGQRISGKSLSKLQIESLSLKHAETVLLNFNG
jgi:hypothetical protein